jgi:hypothetical protein
MWLRCEPLTTWKQWSEVERYWKLVKFDGRLWWHIMKLDKTRGCSAGLKHLDQIYRLFFESMAEEILLILKWCRSDERKFWSSRVDSRQTGIVGPNDVLDICPAIRLCFFTTRKLLRLPQSESDSIWR